MTKIILASNNKGKIKEVKEICKDMQVEIVSMKEAGIDIDIEENGTTFEENALIKAEAVMKLTGELTIADDSGLEVDYLNKEPGVYSARYMGHDTSYDPIVYLPQYGKTSAELTPEEKNKISHRGEALEKLKAQLAQYLN